MSMKCERCQMEFKYASILARHLAKKKLCEIVRIEEPKSNGPKCKFCKRPVCSTQSKQRHEKTCKFKDDYVRNLELELEVEVDYEYSNTTCRFCDKTMRSDHLFRHESSCKEKEIYKVKLQNMLEAHKSKQGQGNTTINNNINIVNVTLRPFGQENLEYMTPSKILEIFKKGKCQFSGLRELHNFIAEMQRCIWINPEHPENHNMLIPSLKGSAALVYTDEGFEYIPRRDAESKAIETINDVTHEKIELGEGIDDSEERIRQQCLQRYPRFVHHYISEGGFEENYKTRQVIGQTSYSQRHVVKSTHKQIRSDNLLE